MKTICHFKIDRLKVYDDYLQEAEKWAAPAQRWGDGALDNAGAGTGGRKSRKDKAGSSLRSAPALHNTKVPVFASQAAILKKTALAINDIDSDQRSDIRSE